MRTRTAAPGDAKALAALISLAYRVEDFFTVGDRTNEDEVAAKMKKATFLILEDDAGAMAGCVYVDVRGDSGYFGMLSVEPSHQGQGLGKRLIEAAERFCVEAGCRAMEIEVVNLRAELPAFYRAIGYAETGTRPFTPGERTKLPCHFIVMTKALTATV
jgi:GNAT superfamily N-acetyltransferase